MMHLNKSVLFHNIFDILFEEYLMNLFSNGFYCGLMDVVVFLTDGVVCSLGVV